MLDANAVLGDEDVLLDDDVVLDDVALLDAFVVLDDVTLLEEEEVPVVRTTAASRTKSAEFLQQSPGSSRVVAQQKVVKAASQAHTYARSLELAVLEVSMLHSLLNEFFKHTFKTVGKTARIIRSIATLDLVQARLSDGAIRVVIHVTIETVLHTGI